MMAVSPPSSAVPEEKIMSEVAQRTSASPGVLVPVAGLDRAHAEPVPRPAAETGAPQGLELRHLRYFVALADAGSFTRAAEQIFIAQPTLSQQIRRLEEIVGTPLLRRRREGLQLTRAGRMLLDGSRTVLAQVNQAVSQTRQAAGLGRPRLRVVLPSCLPESLAVAAAAGLPASAVAAQVDVTWLEMPLDAEFSLIGTRRADAGLGWLTTSPEALPAALEAMVLGEFEPEVWIPSAHLAARRGAISLEELAGLQVIHGPRRLEPGTYDAWTTVMQTIDSRFEFTDPPFRCSLPVTLAFAASGNQPAAVLTGPATVAGGRAGPVRRSGPADASGMVRVSLQNHPLTASAALVWSAGLPRPLQQILFETADSLTAPAPPRPAELVSLTTA
jgi:DNA-binding transcriptional LysR family regulator